jgi:hypothetical protein
VSGERFVGRAELLDQVRELTVELERERLRSSLLSDRLTRANEGWGAERDAACRHDRAAYRH